MASDGEIFEVKDRKLTKAVLGPPEMASAYERTAQLPPELYAAFFLHQESLMSIAAVLASVSPDTAQRIAKAVTEMKPAEKSKPTRRLTQPSPQTEPAPTEEPVELREERIRARARARAKAASEEKLAKLQEITPTAPESLSIRHSIKE